MRPTARGVGVAAVFAGALAAATVTESPALNAVAAPALVALLAGAVQVLAADEPAVERATPDPGHPGETRTVELSVEGSGPSQVTDALPQGVTGAGTARVTLPATATHEVTLAERGAWSLGPVTVAVTDVLGLFVRTSDHDATATLVVYPPVHDAGDLGVGGLLDGGLLARRGTFDSVRDYTPGDPLRDVHWKSSARRASSDLVVAEYVDEHPDPELTVAAAAADGYADAMAAGAATVALRALDAGLAVGVDCPAGREPPGRGPAHRRRLLALLARTGEGDPGERARTQADAVVRADADGVTLALGDREDVLAVPRDDRGVVSG